MANDLTVKGSTNHLRFEAAAELLVKVDTALRAGDWETIDSLNTEIGAKLEVLKNVTTIII